MEVKGKKRPTALIVDDESFFCEALVAFLQEVGVDANYYLNAKDFLGALKESKPDLCFVDINIGTFDVGYKLIQAIRSKLGYSLPLLMVSGRGDADSISHAMELGASDYLVKPFDLEQLRMKIEPYLDADSFSGDRLLLKQVPKEQGDLHLEFSYKLHGVDEFGIFLRGTHLLGKGTPIWLNSSEIHNITGMAEEHLLKVVSSSLEPGVNEFVSYLEFDSSDEQLLSNVRKWVLAHQK